MNRVKGKTIIVTGGAVGIGRAISLILAQEGAKVAVTDLQDEAGRKVVEEITKAGGSAAFWHMDVSNESEVKRMFAQIVGKFGGIDVLVNNAGISGTDKPTHEITCEEWDQVMAVNVKGVFLCTREALLTMRESGGGSIINLSSIYGIVGAPDLPVYHASKGAVRMMTKTDALLYAKEKIRVNSVHPGFIWTPLVEDLGERSDEGVEKFRENLDSLHP
ncbi:MAG: SDR family NAD(P)-dependent oxidoreductase, partial [Verrucomicrobiales bacterium]|nr:SDR family NAD(P)-dependent oxidoreductase [Verrucomicrobiales bacterium]